MEGGKEQNYWPGFVDALSNVVLTLVFVLVIFVFALVMASNKVEQKMQEVVQNEQRQKEQQSEQMVVQNAVQQEVEELRKQLAIAKQEIEKLSELQSVSASDKKYRGASEQSAVADQNEDMHIKIDDKAQVNNKRGALNIQRVNDKITLGYPLQIAEMDEKSAAELGHVLDAVQKSMGKHKIVIRSIVGKESYSAARRLAYYRAIGARNFLITKGGENPSMITTTIVQPTQPEDGRVEIQFQKQ